MAVFLDTRLLNLITFAKPQRVKLDDDAQARIAAHHVRGWMSAICDVCRIGPQHPQQLTSEFPVEFHFGPQAGSTPPEDLFWLCATVGAIESLLPLHAPSKRVDPRTWKGTIKKETKTAQIVAELSRNPHEKAVLDMHCRRVAELGFKGKQLEQMQGHAIDAAGIGLWDLGRVRVLH